MFNIEKTTTTTTTKKNTLDLRMIVKSYLDRRGVMERRFQGNLPGQEWVSSFLKRHKRKLSQHMCYDIKGSTANRPKEEFEEYLQNLKETLDGTPPSHVKNFDESNLSDDPGQKKVITKKGTKYPKRVMNSSESEPCSCMLLEKFYQHMLSTKQSTCMTLGLMVVQKEPVTTAANLDGLTCNVSVTGL